MQSSVSAATKPESDIPASRRFLRRIKSGFFRSAAVYRLYLRCRYGGRVSDGLSAGLPNGVLQSRAEWQQATETGKQFTCPFTGRKRKTGIILPPYARLWAQLQKTACVLDAGAEFYSNVLPALFRCGYRHLYGMNLSFTDPARRGPIQYSPETSPAPDFPMVSSMPSRA